jgi:hypothetical protein
MKGCLTNETNYLLNNNDNYRKDFNTDISYITKKYYELVSEYLKFIIENNKIKNTQYSKFIIIRGLNTVTNVFNYILYFTKNIELTYFHCQKSYYFYVEFVGQITEDDKMFLQLTSRDAATYVYKKTIFDINNELKKINENGSESFREKIENINSFINLYQTYLLKIIQSSEKILDDDINNFLKISNKLNKFTNKINIKQIENIIEKLNYKISDKNLFFHVNQLMLKQILKNDLIIEKYETKLNSYEFEEKILESPDKFMKWLSS